MKHLLIFTCCFLATMNTDLSGKIVEAKHFGEILNYVDQVSVVIVDIDDTLLVPVQTLGTDAWFLTRLKHYQKQEEDSEIALDKALAEWEAIRHLTQVKIVEAKTDEVLQKMQKSMTIIGMTTQGLALATRTVQQLNSLDIDLSKSAPSQEDLYFVNGANGVLYRKGILFTAGTHKGEAVFKFFDEIDFHPEKIVFINDKKTALEEVEKSAASKGVTFIGLRYSYSDKRIADYSQEIADYQWKNSTLSNFISDEEAIEFFKDDLIFESLID